MPVFLDGPIRLFDSFAIAEHADRVGAGETLFPEEHRAAIVRWNAASERALRSARKRSFERLLEDDDGLADQLRTVAPSALRPCLVPVARQAVRFMQSKYGSDALRARFPDLVAWRNELYRRHGPPRRRSVTLRDTPS